MSSEVADLAIIGGGIVGLATAMALSETGTRLTILEAEPVLASHQTGHNSGVIHSGLYYRPGSSKARTCVSGREALYRFCEEEGLPFERCGKIVVAIDDSERPALAELERRGQANGLRGIRRLRAGEIREIEPHAAGIEALHVPETGIVDFSRVALRMADRVVAAGGTIRTRSRVLSATRTAEEWILGTTTEDARARFVVNCAGLQSDRIARLCGIEPNLRIVPFRGEYYELRPDRRELVRNLVYPVPDPAFPFLGVHFTRRIGGAVEAGPNAVLAWKREGYRKTDLSPRDVLESALYPGFWRMAFRFWRTGALELYRSYHKPAFVKALRRLLPEITAADLRPAGSGVRAQAVEPNGFLVDDFRIIEGDRMLHVLNAPSPAATASITIGREIASRVAAARSGRSAAGRARAR